MSGFVFITEKPSRGSSECKKWTSKFAGSPSTTCAIDIAAAFFVGAIVQRAEGWGVVEGHLTSIHRSLFVAKTMGILLMQ